MVYAGLKNGGVCAYTVSKEPRGAAAAAKAVREMQPGGESSLVTQ